ncbi:family 43 glycosylhydrolase [Faecalicatena orotica]|uniref:Glycosyl hydrolase family 43 n=1 Tax=Faecalicatena orotica TaxID=1544 RepID=A0A2Y9BPF4_9FIRM|nr:family 43 glycosylhydrolase [Faecalicatena orotica]PWJ21528.1 glycosyl hydrolase family 43 [Faecalicatena orotica]SSA58338.1 Glycosyl hydrolases family 43 [Faecalicatena orotica]
MKKSKKHYCNPMNLEYRYQFKRSVNYEGEEKPFAVFREAADPTLILFKGLYYLFPSMTAGFFTSEDLYDWKFYEFGPELPAYDYAPDVRAVGEYMYFSASSADKNCSFYRTEDPRTESFEEIPGTFPFWDPNLFVDDDGRIYLYWGSSNTEPIYGVELNPETMAPIGEKQGLVTASEKERGYERMGEDHIPPKTEEEIEAEVDNVLVFVKRQMDGQGMSEQFDEETYREKFRITFGNKPYLEGVWMTKYQGKYYLQYAFPGTEYNVYGDAVYVGDSPLGPFVSAKNNPYSYVPDGFITAAGHGSTLVDKEGKMWHIASMRIAHSEKFERRLGLWKAGVDEDGELFCDQRYADWPIAMDAEPFEKPDWMLLSYGKEVTASSGNGMQYVTDEDIRTFWKADTCQSGEWLQIDLGTAKDVAAIQLHFVEDELYLPIPEGKEAVKSYLDERYIDMEKQQTCWVLEGSEDGTDYHILMDKSRTNTDYSDDFIELPETEKLRFIKLTIVKLPYDMVPTVSGIRVFGNGNGDLPKKAENVVIKLEGDLDMDVSWNAEDAVGVNILWGYVPDKLYHSCIVYKKNEKRIAALVKGQSVYARIDTFNENGITEGAVIKVR